MALSADNPDTERILFNVTSMLKGRCLMLLNAVKCYLDTKRAWVAQWVKSCPTDLAVPVSRPSGGGNLVSRKRGFHYIQPFIITNRRRPDMTVIQLKRT